MNNINHSWDKNESEDIKIFRRMLWDDPREVYKRYGKGKLARVFKAHAHKADRRNLRFWEIILDVKDEELEVNRDPARRFRRDCKIWGY